MDPNTLTTLLIYNPWIENADLWKKSIKKHMPQSLGYPYIRRFADDNPSWPQKRKINLIIGPRQSGKSTLIWNTLSSMKPNVVYVNANELAIREWCSSPAMVTTDIFQIVENPAAIFFEEVHYITNAGLFLKGLSDLNLDVPIFATGSSSFHLQDQMRESLAGRAERLLLFPFSMNEWHTEASKNTSLVHQHNFHKKLFRMLVFGSYPEACFSDRPEHILNRLVEAFIIRDASDVFRIKHIAKFRKLLALMASQISNLVNFSDWASITGLDVKTAENYASILENSHVIKLLPPFVGGKRAEIISAPKIYFIDNGIRNLMVHQFNDFDIRADKGALFENWVFSELHKNSSFTDTLYYWRSKSGAEVDFVRQRGKFLQSFEAKAGNLRRPVISRSARSFIDAYAPNYFFIVNMSLTTEKTLGKTKLRWLTPLEFLNMLGA